MAERTVEEQRNEGDYGLEVFVDDDICTVGDPYNGWTIEIKKVVIELDKDVKAFGI